MKTNLLLIILAVLTLTISCKKDDSVPATENTTENSVTSVGVLEYYLERVYYTVPSERHNPIMKVSPNFIARLSEFDWNSVIAKDINYKTDIFIIGGKYTYSDYYIEDAPTVVGHPLTVDNTDTLVVKYSLMADLSDGTTIHEHVTAKFKLSNLEISEIINDQGKIIHYYKFDAYRFE